MRKIETFLLNSRFNVVVTQRAKKEMAQAEKAQQAAHLKNREKSDKKIQFHENNSCIADKAEPESEV